MNWNPPLKTISQAMTWTTPQEVANGSAIAKNPKAMSRIAQTIDFPEPSSESAVGAIVSSFLFLFLVDLVSVYLLHELPDFAHPRRFSAFAWLGESLKPAFQNRRNRRDDAR